MPLPAAHYWFAWMPAYEEGVEDRPASLSTLADSITGAEERAVWLPAARRTLRYALAPRSVSAGVRMADQLRAARVTGRASVPHWGRGRLLSAYAAGSAVVTTDLAHGLAAGAMAALYRPGDEAALLVEVLAVASATQLTLAAPVPAAWSGPAWLAPVLHGRVVDGAWSPAGDLRRLQVDFAEYPVPPAPAPSWAPYEIDSSHLWTVSLYRTWDFTDAGFMAAGQDGAERAYSDPSEVAYCPWSFVAGNKLGLRLDWEDSENCGGFNDRTQTATAQAVLRVSTSGTLTVTWSGMGELEASDFELMELYFGECDEDGVLVAGETLVGQAHAPGGGLGCAEAHGRVGPVVSDPAPPQTAALEGGKYYRVRVHATTNDGLYHVGAYYQFTLSFSATG